MSEYTERTTGELVQPIILLVDRENPAGQDLGIAAAALASAKAFLNDPENPDWQQWAAGAFAKSVRRADAKMFAKVLTNFPEHVAVDIAEARAAAFAPMPADQLPKLLAKLQVSGTQLPPSEENGEETSQEEPPSLVTIVLNKSLEMSTGKAAAQAAHALFAWVIEAGAQQVQAWIDADFSLDVQWLERKEFRKGQRKAAGPIIHDAGRTEIEPGSTTAFVVSKLPR